MAKLGASFNWDRGSTIITDDYSGNGNVSEGMTDITIGSGIVGNTAIFNGSTSTIKFDNNIDVGGLDTISCLVQVKRTSSKDQILFFKNKHVFLLINSDNTVTFSLFIGIADTSITSTGTIDTSSATIECIYDGVKMFIYINGLLDNSKAQVGNIVASLDDFAIGHFNFGGDSLFFAGEMEALDFRVDALDANQVLAWHTNPLGTEYVFQNEHNLALGDIVAGGKIFAGLTPDKIGSISFVLDDFTLRIKPILDQFNLNEVPVRRANIFDEARQWLAEMQVSGDEPFLQIKDRIKSIGDSLPGVEASKGFKATKDAFIFKHALIMDFVIEPPSEPAAINDFAPTDLEFANTLYISSDNPVNWNGLLAPVPVRAQLIFVINIGTKNITAKNNAGASSPVNRFQINGNVIFSPDQMGFVLYDVARSRWRVNKI